MLYSKYYKQGQTILMKPLSPDSPSEHYEALTAYFQRHEEGYFDLTLPYQADGEESYPFSQGMPFELLSEAFGLGIRMTGSFESHQKANRIRININNDLQVFQRRENLRADIKAGLRYTKGTGKLRSFRELWEKNVRILQKDHTLLKLGGLPRCPINLSSSGIRFSVKPPVETADLCLILLELEPDSRPICTLAEVVWTGKEESDGRYPAGMRFVNIMESDQKIIDDFVKAKIRDMPEESNPGR